MALGVFEKSIVDDEAVLEALVLLQVGEAFLLHACGVQDIGLRNDLWRQPVRLQHQLSRVDNLLPDFLGQGQVLGSNELHTDIVELE